MKNLKLLGVLLASLILPISVNAANVKNQSELMSCVKNETECVITDNITLDGDVEFSEGKIVIPEGKTLTLNGYVNVTEGATLKVNGLIKVNGVLDAENMLFTYDENGVGLYAGQNGKLSIKSTGVFIALKYWDDAFKLQNGIGWGPKEGEHLLESCETGATIISGDKTFSYVNNEWKGAILVGNNDYKSVEEVVIPDGTVTIKLLSDVYSQKGLNIPENAKVKIDLNGKKLTVTNDHGIIVDNGATVTIIGNGEVDAKKAAVFNKGGNVTIEDGIYTSSTWYTIKNLADMTISGGTFGQTDEKNTGNSSLISNGWYSSKDEGVTAPDKTKASEAKAIMTINGGTFNHYTTTSTIKSDDWSKTTITDGTFNSAKGTLVQATGEVLVSGGNFIGYNSIALFNGTEEKGYEPALLTISGGTFTAKYIIWPYTKGTLTINDGIFNGVEKFVNTEKTGTDAKYIITGGKFVIDVNEYLTNGLYATKNDNLYVVGKPVVESEIKVLDPEKIEEVKEVVVGVKESEKTDTIIANSILKDEQLAKKTKDISIKVDVEIETIEEDKASEKVKTAIKSIKEKAGKATIAHFFDISILVKNTNNGAHIGNVNELTEEIELMILLPENLKNTNNKVNREYFIVREHNGKIETIKAELSKDEKYLIFKSDKFSTYALAYEDKAVVDSSIADTKVEAKPNVEVPKTFDGITATLILSAIALIGLVGTSLYLKKQTNK